MTLQKAIVVGDPLQAAVALLALGVGLYAAISQLWLYGEMKRRGARMSGLFSTTFLYLEYQYLKHRRSIGDPRLDWIALSSFLAPVVFVALLIALSRFWPMSR